MYISGINYESISDGYGVRATIYISGCLHNCKGCQNVETHNFENGTKVNEELIKNIKEEIAKRPFLRGITLSGGDPMYQPTEVIELLNKLNLPTELDIWCYTGFDFDNLTSNPNKLKLLERCSVVVDGEFKEELRDITSKFKGSSNQRVIDVKKSLKEKKVILWKE